LSAEFRGEVGDQFPRQLSRVTPVGAEKRQIVCVNAVNF